MKTTLAGSAGLVVLVWCAAAFAEQLPFERQIPLGRPVTLTNVRAVNTPNGVDVFFGARRHTLDGVQATAVEAESVVLSSGGAVGLITVQTDTQAHLIAIGKRKGAPSVIWSGIVGLRGDPGERRGHVVVRSDRDGDGIPDLGIAEQHDSVRTCDTTVARVRAQWIDSATLDFEHRIVEVETAGETGATSPVPVLAVTQTPTGVREHPQIQVLRGRWSTTSRRSEPLSDLPAGAALLDRDRAQPWDGGDTEHARAVFGILGSGLAVRHLAFDVQGGGGGQLRLRGDNGDWFHVTLPPSDAPANRYWVRLPTPAHWNCLEIAAARHDGHLLPIPPITELEVFTEIDAEDGVAQLVARVITDEQRGAEAAGFLVSLGEPGISALKDRWEQLGPRGQRRAIEAVADHATRSTAARTILALAVASTDENLASRGLSALVRAKREAFPELAVLAKGLGNAGDQASLAIGQSQHPEAVPTLLHLLTISGGDRAMVRQGLADALAAAGTGAVSQVELWLQGDVPPTALAAALSVLAANAPTQTQAMRVWERLVPLPLEFPERWRTILAARSLPSSAAVDQWLAAEAVAPGITWMLRDAALTSLNLRHAELAQTIAEKARFDDSPRVRATAIAVLGAVPEHRAQLAASLPDESWPSARVAIIRQIFSVPESPSILVRALRDPAVRVRIAAIEGLTQASSRASWPVLAERLRDENEWPAVMAAVIQFAGALCITDATSDLRAVIKRGIKPNAWAPDVDLAMEAVTVLGQLGTEDARRLLAAIQGQGQPPAFRDAATRALRGKTCGSPGGTQSRPVE